MLQRVLNQTLTGFRRVWSAPLEWRFLAFSVVVLVAGAYVIGSWTTGEIEGRVLQRAAATNALYVDSFVHPYLQELDGAERLTPGNIAALDSLLNTTALGETVVSFKVWTRDGEVLYATDKGLIGQFFPPEDHLRNAVKGNVSASVTELQDDENIYEREHWDKLVETYAPVHSEETGELLAVAEFYQLPDGMLGEIRSSQNQGWLIVGVATFVMFVVLNGMVRQASRTIHAQRASLEGFNRQLRAASASKVETEEQALTRLAQELHDAPAQGLAVALLRLDGLEQSSPAAYRGDWLLVREAVGEALADLRNISGGMRAPEMEGLDAAQIISLAVTNFTKRTGTQVVCQTAGVRGRLSPAAKVATFRIAQEALNNSWLHAKCSNQSVVASVNGDQLRMEVLDDGVGFNPEGIDSFNANDRTRLGLRGMRERAELLGGTLQIDAAPGAGTRIIVRIPVEEDKPGE